MQDEQARQDEPAPEATRRAKVGRSRANRPKPPRTGKTRPRAEVLRLVDVCEEGVLHRMSKQKIRELLGKAAGLPGPMSSRTTDKYLARVAKRHAENPLPSLEQEREAAARRYLKMIVSLRAGGAKNADAILRWETRYAALVGMDAPRDKEAIEAQAQAIVDKLLAKARQERAAAQAQADYQIEEERRRQWEAEEQEQRRMIDVGEVPPGDSTA